MKTLTLTILVCILSVQISNAQWVYMSNVMGNVGTLAANSNTIFAGSGWSTPYGVCLSTNNGTNWTQTSLNNREVQSLVVNGNNVFAGTLNYGVYISTNNGTTWTQTSLNNQHVHSLAVNGNNIFAGTGSIFLSTNNGTTWAQTSYNGTSVWSLAVNGNNIFAGTAYGVYLSTNNGTSWTQTSLNNHNVWSLAVNGNNIFAGTDNGVYLSTNNSTTWTQTSLNYGNVYSIAVNGNNIFVGTYNYGVYVSNNNGTSWTQRIEGLGNAQVGDFCILNNYIFASTGTSGVYRRQLSELVGIKPISSEMPSQFSLPQNYPNPFNPSTTIKFSIPANSNVKLAVFNSAGQEVASLVNGEMNVGTYEYQFDAGKLSSGVYFYKLITDGFSDTKKMILVK